MSESTYWAEKSKNLETNVHRAIELGCECRDIPIVSASDERESRSDDINRLIAYKRLWKAAVEYDSAVEENNFNSVRTPLPYIVNDNLYENTDTRKSVEEARGNLRFDFVNRITSDGQVVHVGDTIKVNECSLTSNGAIAKDIVYGMVVCFVTHISDMQDTYSNGKFTAIVIDTAIPMNGIKSFTNINDKRLRCVINSRRYAVSSLPYRSMPHVLSTSPNPPFNFSVVKQADFGLSGTYGDDVLGTKAPDKPIYIEYATTISSIEDAAGNKMHVMCGKSIRRDLLRKTSHSGEYAYCVSLKADACIYFDDFVKFREQTCEMMPSLLREVNDPRVNDTSISTLEQIVNESLSVDLIELSKAPSKTSSHRVVNARLLYALPSVKALGYDVDKQDTERFDDGGNKTSDVDDANNDGNNDKTPITIVVEPSLYSTQYDERNRKLNYCAAIYDSDGNIVDCNTLPNILECVISDGYQADQVKVIIDRNGDCLDVTEFKELKNRFGDIRYQFDVEYVDKLPQFSDIDAGTDLTDLARGKYQEQKRQQETELRRELEAEQVEQQRQQQEEIIREMDDASERIGNISWMLKDDPYLSELFDPDDDPDDDDAYY